MSLPLLRRLSFEHKLLIAFLILGALPSVIVLGGQMRRLDDTIEFWENPGVDGALEASVELLRGAIAEREARNMRTAEQCLELLGDLAGAEAGMDSLLAVTIIEERFGTDAPTDVRLWEVNGSDREVLFTHITSSRDIGPIRMMRLTAERKPGKLLEGDFGFTPPDNFIDRREAIADGYRYYLQLGVYKRLARGNLRFWTALIVVGTVLLAIIVARVLSRSMSRPILSLSEGTQRVREGDLSVRIASDSSDDIGVLVESFNAMTRDLEVGRDKLARAERVAAWAAAARRIAHEIRNPLTPITLSLHRLAKRTELLPPEERAVSRECLDSILEEVENLKSLAGEFSEFARLPAPKISPTALHDLLRRVSGLYIEGRSVEIEWDLIDGDPAVRGDRELLWRAFSNLIKNAVEAMDGKGVLEIETRRSGEWVTVRIADNGPGFPGNGPERIFDPYFTTKETGTGLGLALVERIVHDHGGHITAGNRPEGGATFTMTLPIAIDERHL